ncbi:hypothetical protein C8Q80DRAFT_1217332 [Daedaleopsis nitida]|nr:hypothetical protein C8Q80DRAFT_1217332 [Daedaleopsis nitida]
MHRRTWEAQPPALHAGAPIDPECHPTVYKQYQSSVDASGTNPYAPFKSRIDWELAKWAKMRGPGSTAVTELLQIEDLVSLLGLSFKNSRELDQIVDGQLASGRPRFIRRKIIVAGEVFDIFYRDILQCVRALYGDPEFTGILVFTPERHYTDADKTVHVYFDMHTGQWWWDTQKKLEKQKPGATVIPIIISSDKTQLTVFGSKTAYPVYMTLGNLPKDVRRCPSHRGQILLAYLPSTRLEHITSKTVRPRVHTNLFHKCMSLVLKPLIKAGIHGISVTSGDGVTRCGHSIFTMYIGNYPEELQVTCCKNGLCPKCDIPCEDVGSTTDQQRALRDLGKVLDALGRADESATAFSRACREAGIQTVRNPFWQHLPCVNIYRSITPDILHQLYQGVVKHVISWLTTAYGAGEIDARCRRLPLHDGMSPVRLVHAVRAILDFLYLAHYLAHTSDTLGLLRNALEHFHANKSIFIDFGIRAHFRLPKLHSLDHYITSIKLFGTTDNYDTQYTEHLHIDFTKEAYRATNHSDEFPQMMLWLKRHEKILRHNAYVTWRLQHYSSCRTTPDEPQVCPRSPILDPYGAALTRMSVVKWPTVKALRFDAAVNSYGATFIRDALARFVVTYKDPSLTRTEVEHESLRISYPFATLPVFHKIKFILEDAEQLGIMESTHDVLHAGPARQDRQGQPVPARFDTVLVNDGTGGASGVEGYRVGRVRLIFKLTAKAWHTLVPDVIAPGHLAYVEWFTPFTEPDRVHGMYKVSKSCNREKSLLASVIEIRHIRRSCHLLPVAPPSGIFPRDWTSSTVLDKCEHFFVSPFSDMHIMGLVRLV